MKRNDILDIIGSSLIGLAIGAGIGSCMENYRVSVENVVKEPVKVEKLKGLVLDKLHKGRVYPSSQVPANMCSRYVRLLARDEFGIEYPRADAWELRNNPEVDEIQVTSKEDLEELARSNFLKPGMILGLYNPNSRYNGEASESGARYTHVALYLGIDEKVKLYFADKFGNETRTKISLDELLQRGDLTPKEVLFLSRR